MARRSRGIYARKNQIWLRYKDASGKWVGKPSGYPVGQEALALKLREKVVEMIAAGQDVDDVDTGPITVRRYGKKWLSERRKRGLRSVDDDEQRLTDHVYPALGDYELTKLRPRHVRQLINKLMDPERKPRRLAPRTVRHVYRTLSNLLNDAVVDDLLDVSPACLKRHHIPANVDAKPGWRETAIFTRNEVACLISDPRIPPDRRVLYALLGWGGKRVGEATPRRWRDLDTAVEPLAKLSIVTCYSSRHREEFPATKIEGVVRYLPVHPALHSVLRDWWLGGWARAYGRHPKPDDLIVPSNDGGIRHKDRVNDEFGQDLATLGLRHRRVHDLRRTFISIARSDGARSELVKWITHGPGKTQVDDYTSFPWDVLCGEIAKMKLALLPGNVIEMPRAATGGDSLHRSLHPEAASADGADCVGDCVKITADLAEEEGFEPPGQFPSLRFSRPAVEYIGAPLRAVSSDGSLEKSQTSASGTHTESASASVLEPFRCSECSESLRAVHLALEALDTGDVAAARWLLQGCIERAHPPAAGEYPDG